MLRFSRRTTAVLLWSLFLPAVLFGQEKTVWSEHEKPIANGYSGYFPRAYTPFQLAMAHAGRLQKFGA